MTEPDIASSDGSNIQLRMERKGDHYLLNGSKWWSSGAGDDRCKIFIVMGKTDPFADKFRQQSMMLVPTDTPGITVHRMLSVYGYDDAPHGHGHITFKDVKVPHEALLLGEGRGNEIMQGRLGPGRIHHCMRAIGAAEVALEWMIHRMHDERKIPFGKPLNEHGVLIEWVAKARMEIDASRLVVLNAAIKIDQKDAKFALKEIAEVCHSPNLIHDRSQAVKPLALSDILTIEIGKGISAQHGPHHYRQSCPSTRRYGRLSGHSPGQHVGSYKNATYRGRTR